MRLRRVSPASPGWTRRRCGAGFRYFDTDGRPLGRDDVARCKALAIPPAWTDVWICPLANGHLQALGSDDAGRRQYLYHAAWRTRRDQRKHDHVLLIGRRLAAARRTARRHLAASDPTRQRALATAFLLLDLGLFRVGGENYREQNGSFGLATIERRHVHVAGDDVTFDYPAKSGQRRVITVSDRRVSASVAALHRRRGGGPQLLAYRQDRRWHDITSRDIGDYVKQLLGPEATSKDFRTWHATVSAAVELAGETGGTDAVSRPGRGPLKKSVRRAIEQVAHQLGDTPAVVRKSYVDPRVADRFAAGETIATGRGSVPRGREQRERAVLRLLAEM